MADSTTKPQVGDIFIIALPHHSDPAFNVGTDLAHPQLSCPTYEAALQHATHTARRVFVDVWKTADRSSFECVARYRRRAK